MGLGPPSLVAAAVLAAVVTGCGGGGGGGDAASGGSSTPAEQPAENPSEVVPDPGVSNGPSLALGADAFYLKADAALDTRRALDALAGGTALFEAWNPNNPNTALKPGMKVMFFGSGVGCSEGIEGPLTSITDERLAAVAGLTGLDASSAPIDMRWAPSGASTGCANSSQNKHGGSAVFLNAHETAGAIGMLTTTGRQPDGQTSFFGAFDASGQNGQGANAWISGTFVNFRQAWWLADPMQPWTGQARARLASKQSVGSFTLDAGPSGAVQAKQQMMATFLNKRCADELGASGKPCQVQYLLNTAIARSGVSDWTTVRWFQNGSLSFDPAQGSIPVVDGPIKATGQTTVDADSGLALYTSQGSATQHSAFKNRSFDATISFDQLLNVVRITTAKTNKIDLGQVNDQQIASLWGSGWRDRNAWVLLSSDVGQEVYNPDNQRRVEVAGGFSDLYVGPQP